MDLAILHPTGDATYEQCERCSGRWQGTPSEISRIFYTVAFLPLLRPHEMHLFQRPTIFLGPNRRYSSHFSRLLAQISCIYPRQHPATNPQLPATEKLISPSRNNPLAAHSVLGSSPSRGALSPSFRSHWSLKLKTASILPIQVSVVELASTPTAHLSSHSVPRIDPVSVQNVIYLSCTPPLGHNRVHLASMGLVGVSPDSLATSRDRA